MLQHKQAVKNAATFEGYVTIKIMKTARRKIEACRDIFQLCHDIICEESIKTLS